MASKANSSRDEPRLNTSSIICWVQDKDSNPHYIPNDVCRDVLGHVVVLSGSAAASASDVIVGISGHGFLIASDSLTKHPSGPGMQPEETISVFDFNRGPGIFNNTI